MESLRREHGQTILEVALLIAVLILVIISASPSLRNSVISVFVRTDQALGGEMEGQPDDSSPPTNTSPKVIWADELQNLSQWSVLQGNWEASEGFIRNTSNLEGRIMTNFSGEDFVVNIESAHLLQGNGYGVWLRASNVEAVNQNEINGYTFQYDPGFIGGEFIIRKWENGVEQEPLARVSANDFNWNDPHSLRVVVKGDTFTVFVNDEETLSAQDSSYTSGYVGLRTWSNTRVEVSGFTIEEISEDD
jgi:Flp pilus assembly pilin Flp